MEWKQLRLRADIHEKLKTKADAEKISMGELIERLLGAETTNTPDEADVLMDKMENSPEDLLSVEDRKLFDELEPGELPECCQELYSGKKCRHWRKTYVNYYGRKVLGYQNTLTGGTNYDYQTLYEQ